MLHDCDKTTATRTAMRMSSRVTPSSDTSCGIIEGWNDFIICLAHIGPQVRPRDRPWPGSQKTARMRKAPFLQGFSSISKDFKYAEFCLEGKGITIMQRPRLGRHSYRSSPALPRPRVPRKSDAGLKSLAKVGARSGISRSVSEKAAVATESLLAFEASRTHPSAPSCRYRKYGKRPRTPDRGRSGARTPGPARPPQRTGEHLRRLAGRRSARALAARASALTLVTNYEWFGSNNG